MKKLTFTCELLTDVILNQNAATTGNQRTLDFIPGNNFLGIAAGILYKNSDSKNLAIFHSGSVRFGDAHPSVDNKRSLRIPACMYYPKLKKASELCYIHHGYDDKKDEGKEQLKQCRKGFYIFDVTAKKATEVKSLKTFAIKSAYDGTERRSKDSMMYGYQSLDKGQTFIFTVELTDDAEKYAEEIKEALSGEKRIGRSRTAQYGLVNIAESKGEPDDYSTDQSQISANGGRVYTVYADSRLIFLDKESGIPTFRPSVADLGFAEGEIDWENSQIRTFQYAPWNFIRQSRDTDRCGIEKGSVFVIKDAKQSPYTSCYVGAYKNEGFGHVIYNPVFLNFDKGKNGIALFRIFEGEKEEKKKDMTQAEVQNLLDAGDNPLLQYLGNAKQKEYFQNLVYSLVNDFAKSHKDIFEKGRFASQWGTIRSIASQHKDKITIETEIKEYISHGVAQDQWDKKRRKDLLLKFINDTDSSYTQMAVINLAAEMAKLAHK